MESKAFFINGFNHFFVKDYNNSDQREQIITKNNISSIPTGLCPWTSFIYPIHKQYVQFS